MLVIHDQHQERGIFDAGAPKEAGETGHFQSIAMGVKKGRTVVVRGPGSSIVVVVVIVDNAVVVRDEGILSSFCMHTAFLQPQRHELKQQSTHAAS